jgi:large subunit ribosomal protein L9
MKIILLKDIPKIGRKGDVKDVADGYALNFVLPQKLGVKATAGGIKKVEASKSAIESERKMQENLLSKSLENLSTITVTITEKANEKGHLFEGIRAERLAQEIQKQSGIVLDAGFIELEKPLKEVGNFIVAISAHGKKGKVKVVIEALD